MKNKLLLILMMLTAAMLSAQHPGSIEFGKRMYDDGYLQEASIVFERIISTNPNSSEAEEAYLLLIRINNKNEDYIEAENYARTLYENFPSGRFREKALYYWSVSQYRQGKFSQALETLNRFIQNYPSSLNREEAFYKLISCHYNLTNYSRVLTIARDFINDNPESDRIPDLMLLKAKSHIASKNYNDGENTLEMIIQRHPDSEARWESVGIKAELLKEQVGIRQATEELNKNLSLSNIPRIYEERLRKKLAHLYLKDDRPDAARPQFRELISKFDRSEYLAEYLYWFSQISLEFDEHKEIVEYFNRFDKDIYDTPYYYDFLVCVMEAQFRADNLSAVEVLLLDLQDYLQSGIIMKIPDNRQAVFFWDAKLKEHKGLYLDAIDDYRNLLTQIPANDNLSNQILMRIADIYLNNMQMHSMAINFYNQIISAATVTQVQLSRALYKSALAYENNGEYDKALASLRQINLEALETDEERIKVNNKIELMSRFKTVDYRKSTSKLLFSLVNYLQDDDKESLKDELINIALFELNDIESVLSLLENDNSAGASYVKGKAYLQKIYQTKLEGDEINRVNLRNLTNSLEDYSNLLVQKSTQDPDIKPWADELLIEKKFVENDFQLTPQLLQDIEEYLSSYPKSTASNRFRFLAGSYYKNDSIYVRADEYLQHVTYSADIPFTGFLRVFTDIAAYYFDNEQHEKAIYYYQSLDERDIKRSSDMYRYAVSLMNTNQTGRGVDLLERLVRRGTDFKDSQEAVNVLANHYRSRNDYHQVVNIMMFLPENQRDSSFYREIATGFLVLGNEAEAKESLMRITEKDADDLVRLARLHYRTDDLVMAELSYQQLIDFETIPQSRKKQLLTEANAMIGHIHYLKEDWQNAVRFYEKVLDDVDEIEDDTGLNTAQIAKETVVSLYRVNNRPRAENIAGRFSDSLDNDAYAQAVIKLNEGIYQMTVNRNRASRSFRDIIRNDDYPQEVRYEAHFWRGVNYLEQNNTDDSRKDFEIAANTSNLHLRNKSFLKLGTISFSNERFPEALDYYYTVIQEDVTSELAVDAAKNFAIVCKTIQEWQKAIEAYQIILDRGAGGKLEGETIFNIAFCQFRDRRYDDAIPMFERAITLLNDREMKAEAQYWIGECYSNLGKYEQAATEYLKVGYYYPDLVEWSAIAEIKLSEVYIHQGRVSAARGVLERVVGKYGIDSDWGKQAALILEEL